MIYVVVQRGHDYTIQNFTDSWGRTLRDRIVLLNYSDLAHATHVPPGDYIFTDHDRLSPPQIELGAALADQLGASGRAGAVLNHPGKTKQRLSFLRTMREAGINDFRAFRVTEGWPEDLRFPVFLRMENDHKGSLGGILKTADELRRAIEASGHDRSPHLIVVEFCDTIGPDSCYRKYGAMRIGDRIIPRHVFASKQWVVKLNDDVTPAWVDVELDYYNRFAADFEPHIRRVFDAANVQYGRLDFSMLNGTLRAWEINTNPMLVNTPDVIHDLRMISQAGSAHAIIDAFKAFDSGGDAGSDSGRDSSAAIAIRLDARLQAQLGVTAWDRPLRLVGKVSNRLRRLPGIRAIHAALERARWLTRQ